VAAHDTALRTSSNDASIENYVLGFITAESRKTNKVMPIKL
jgi:hypothetical protein